VAKAHVNPETLEVGRCSAQQGNCPFGGSSGLENHYPSLKVAREVVAERIALENNPFSIVEKTVEKKNQDDQDGSAWQSGRQWGLAKREFRKAVNSERTVRDEDIEDLLAYPQTIYDKTQLYNSLGNFSIYLSADSIDKLLDWSHSELESITANGKTLYPSFDKFMQYVNLNENHINKIINNGDQYQQTALIRSNSPLVTDDHIERLSKVGNDRINEEILRKNDTKSQQVLRNILDFAESGKSKDKINMLYLIANNENTSTEMLQEIQEELAREFDNPDAKDFDGYQSFSELHFYNNALAMRNVVSNPNSNQEIIDRAFMLYTSSSGGNVYPYRPSAEKVLEEVAKNPKTTTETLHKLAKIQKNKWSYHPYILNHPNVSKETLEMLSKDDDWGTRIAVAKNPKTPVETLRRLINDERSDVRNALKENPNTPMKVLLEIATIEAELEELKEQTNQREFKFEQDHKGRTILNLS